MADVSHHHPQKTGGGSGGGGKSRTRRKLELSVLFRAELENMNNALLIKRCPLYPQKRTLAERVGMSALCQKQTLPTALCGVFHETKFGWLVDATLSVGDSNFASA